jgi:hypothetical protein
MPTEEIIVSFIVKVHYGKKVDLGKYLAKGVDWMGEPLNADGCVVKMKYFNHYNINLLKKKVKKHGSQS